MSRGLVKVTLLLFNGNNLRAYFVLLGVASWLQLHHSCRLRLQLKDTKSEIGINISALCTVLVPLLQLTIILSITLSESLHSELSWASDHSNAEVKHIFWRIFNHWSIMVCESQNWLQNISNKGNGLLIRRGASCN